MSTENWAPQTWIKNNLNIYLCVVLTIRSIKYCCIRNSGAFPSATKQISPSAPDPEPSTWGSASQAATFQAGASFFLQKSTDARSEMMLSYYSIQESEILRPKHFFRSAKPSSSLSSTVLSPPSQAHLLSDPWPWPFAQWHSFNRRGRKTLW